MRVTITSEDNMRDQVKNILLEIANNTTLDPMVRLRAIDILLAFNLD